MCKLWKLAHARNVWREACLRKGMQLRALRAEKEWLEKENASIHAEIASLEHGRHLALTEESKALGDTEKHAERLEEYIRRAYNAGSDHDTMNALAEAVAYLEGKDEHA